MQSLTTIEMYNQFLKKIWTDINFPNEDLQFVLGLYKKYLQQLQSVKRQQQILFSIRNSIGLIPQMCDLDAEITYLRIRERKPSTVIEISPGSGWSTSWILHALKDNGNGLLYSYDLVDDSTRVIPRQLSANRWKFYKGDIKHNLGLLPSTEYLFLDADHSKEFTNWYINNLFPLLDAGTSVSVQGIIKWAHETGWEEESMVLSSWLAEKGIDCMTVSKALVNKGYDEICVARVEIGLDKMIQSSNYNSMIFFNL